MTELPYYSARELAGKPGLPGTVSAVIRLAKREDWESRTRSGRGGGREYPLTALPTAAQTALLLHCTSVLPPGIGGPQPNDPKPPVRRASAAALWDYYGTKDNKAKEEAQRRFDLVLAAKKLERTGLSATEARKQVCAQTGTAYRTLLRYINACAGHHQGDWLAALIPGYAGCQVQAEITPAAWDFFKADYLRRDRPTASASYERLERAAEKHGWQLPSVNTLLRKLHKELPPSLITLLRDGEDAYKASRPAQERDRTVFHALEAVNGDGYQFSNYCEFENGEVCQPKTWYWQDLYSSKILAWRTDVSENKDSIRLATHDLISKWGIPLHFWLDNTRAAANKDMTGGVKNRYRFKIKDDEPMGMIPSLGAEVLWTTPGHGQAKPIERAFGIGGLGEYIDKHPAFSGRGTKARPIPVAEFEAVMTQEIAAFNARTGRRGKIAAGKSYDAVFNASYSASTIRKATPRQLALWLLAPAPVTCNRSDGAIKILGNRYWAEELAVYKGRKVVARFDPANLHAGIIVETLGGLEICQAECIAAVGFNDRDAARSTAKENGRIKKHLKKIKESELRISANEAAKYLPSEVPEETPPETRVVAPIFGRKKVVNGDDGSDDPYQFTATINKMTRQILEERRKNRL